MSNSMNMKLLAMDLIRHIGDRVSKTGKPINHLSGVAETIGAPSVEIVDSLVKELAERGLIRVGNTTKLLDGGVTFLSVNLSIDGWEKYEEEKRGGFDGNYGFIAMEFGHDRLDAFFQDIVKPAIREKLGFDLVDLRDVAHTGVIDDFMRVKIKDAKFVIVDLTHDNNGAYWEGGYAEGLGKPVIYTCEKEKFEDKTKSTHFDVNHCTTVPWSTDQPDEFCNRLIAVLHRSLQL